MIDLWDVIKENGISFDGVNARIYSEQAYIDIALIKRANRYKIRYNGIFKSNIDFIKKDGEWVIKNNDTGEAIHQDK